MGIESVYNPIKKNYTRELAQSSGSKSLAVPGMLSLGNWPQYTLLSSIVLPNVSEIAADTLLLLNFELRRKVESDYEGNLLVSIRNVAHAINVGELYDLEMASADHVAFLDLLSIDARSFQNALGDYRIYNVDLKAPIGLVTSEEKSIIVDILAPDLMAATAFEEDILMKLDLSF